MSRWPVELSQISVVNITGGKYSLLSHCMSRDLAGWCCCVEPTMHLMAGLMYSSSSFCNDIVKGRSQYAFASKILLTLSQWMSHILFVNYLVFPFWSLNWICQISQVLKISVWLKKLLVVSRITTCRLLLLVSYVKLYSWLLLPLTYLTNLRSLQNWKTALPSPLIKL